MGDDFSAASSLDFSRGPEGGGDLLGSCEDPTELRGQELKYLVVTGGTLSGLGKGTTISGIGIVLKAMGFRVTAIKIDPYLNIDAGTMSPYEHGEVYVLEDGGEADLDLGNYERSLDITLTKDHNITTGKIYQKVIRQERRGDFLGKTVQVIPHVTNTIQNWIKKVAFRSVDRKAGACDICLIEVGGTVGDIESSIYLEALQQFLFKAGRDNFCLCHLSFLPSVGSGEQREQKTKPTQHSVKELRRAGLLPDFILCRCEKPMSASARAKIALFGQVPTEYVISVHDVSHVYEVPLLIAEQNFGQLVAQKLHLTPRVSPEGFGLNDRLALWGRLAQRSRTAAEAVSIGIVGKYTGTADSYASVVEALGHAALEANLRLKIVWIDSSSLEVTKDEKERAKAIRCLEEVDGVLCPGGFGDRGVEGKCCAAKYCREGGKPFLGICLGMQIAVIEFARNVLGYKDANSEEFDKNTSAKVVVFMPEIVSGTMGGTMRLGSRATIIRDSKSLAYSLYNKNPVVYERHRHRYEVNPEFVPTFEEAGFKFVGQDEKGQRMEIAEIKTHPFFLCCQYHPEFTSRPTQANPCFLGFVLASKNLLKERLERYDDSLCSGASLGVSSDSA